MSSDDTLDSWAGDRAAPDEVFRPAVGYASGAQNHGEANAELGPQRQFRGCWNQNLSNQIIVWDLVDREGFRQVRDQADCRFCGHFTRIVR